MRMILLCTALLTGCAGGLPGVVNVPVQVSCVKEPIPTKPITQTEAELIAMTDYAATLTTWTERLLLKSYAELAEAVITACK